MAHDSYMTPPPIMEKVQKYFEGKLWTDAATNIPSQEYIRAPRWFGVDTTGALIKDALTETWGEYVWLNPPYSSPLINQFTSKCIEEFRKGGKEYLVLVNSQTGTRWYHELIEASTSHLLWKGRIKFWRVINFQEAKETWQTESGVAGNNPRYQSTLFYFGDDNARFKRFFGEYGSLVVKESLYEPKRD